MLVSLVFVSILTSFSFADSMKILSDREMVKLTGGGTVFDHECKWKDCPSPSTQRWSNCYSNPSTNCTYLTGVVGQCTDYGDPPPRYGYDCID